MLETDRLGTYEIYPHVSANTTDGKIHLIYWDKSNSQYSYLQLNGTTFSSPMAQVDISSQSSSLYSNSNDLYLIHILNPLTPGNIKYRQYDAVPLTPQNFSATTYNNHPKITWSACNEPDVYSTGSIKVYRGYEDGSGYISWILAATLSGNSTSWVDNNVTLENKKKIKFY